MLVRALAQIDGREVKAEHLHRAHQRQEARAAECLRVVGGEGCLDELQVVQELPGRGIGVLRRDRMAQRLGAGEVFQRRREPRIHAVTSAANPGLRTPGVPRTFRAG